MEMAFYQWQNSSAGEEGVYPYSYVDSERKLSEIHYPPKETCFNELTQDYISENDYHHGCQAWTTFQLNTLGDSTICTWKPVRRWNYVLHYVTIL